ncbi:MAG TPA: arginine--tRNA ligase [Steroidobacteraceae bacterium]|nr:arginine--tRNA ligase [Steroidobacteraceae bacterium]
MKQQLEQLVSTALSQLVGSLLTEAPDPLTVTVERTRDAQHGDFATNVAMRLAKAARRNPRELAAAIVAALPANDIIAKTEVAGAGFINFFLVKDVLAREVSRIHELGDSYGRSTLGRGQRIIVEFVSANPTGPLHVAHGRHAAYGASLSNVLAAAGFNVHREYYINDAGRQMDILASSVWLRYLETFGEQITIPANGYPGEYLKPVAAKVREVVGERLRRPAADVYTGLPPDEPSGGDKEVYVDAVIERARTLIGKDEFAGVLNLALEYLLSDIRNDLEEFGVVFDRWYSERSLDTSGAIDRALAKLESLGHLYKQDGAIWFRATAFGDEKDRVVVRENGQKTYFASDIAYHLDKRERGFEKLIDVLGSGHHGYIARVRAGLAALGEPPDSLEVPMIQIVTLYRGNEPVKMSKRAGTFVTLRQLRGEVGNDACRFFYLMRSHEQNLDFDLELATSRTNENPVYYVQYAHARVKSLMKELAARGYAFDLQAGLANLSRLDSEHAQALITVLLRYPEAVEQAAINRAPHSIVYYLRELANAFHTYYNAEKVIVDDADLRNARAALGLAVAQVIRNGLALLGVSAPESM